MFLERLNRVIIKEMYEYMEFRFEKITNFFRFVKAMLGGLV